MTTFRIAPDDVGIRNLRLDNRQPAPGAKAVDPVPATPVVHAPEQEPTDSVTERGWEAVEERRKGSDRRKQRRSVLLDTRSRQERRQRENNTPDESDDNTHVGIDIMV